MILAGALAFAAPAVRAHDADVEATRSIDDAYFHRDAAGNLDKSIATADSALQWTAEDGDKLHIESSYRWRRCRSLMRRGEKREKKADKLADYEAARDDCAKSVALNPADADAHFWYGVVMGRWGETKGILKALFLIKPIRNEMRETLKLDPNQGGAHRVLGEILWQVPGFAGGDKKQALVEFETAAKLSPAHSANYQPLAEAYVYFDRKDDAIKTLKVVVDMKNPDDPAEYPGDLADAKKRLEKLAAK
jgi:predicted Zn-dependent protease